MDIRPENNKDTFRGRGKTIEELKEQLGALKSIIRQTYKAIGCSDDIIEGEDWGGLPSRVACLKAAVDLSIQRGKEAEKNLEIYRRIDQLESIVESVLDDRDIEDSYYVLKTDYDAYQEEHYAIKHDRPHKEVGRGRAARVHRVLTAEQIVTAQPMTYAHPSLEEHPPDCPWHKDWHACDCGLFDKQNEDTSKWYDCAHCDAGYPDQECTCEESEE